MLSVPFYFLCIPINVQSHFRSKVGATLAFLSVRYNENLPASTLQQHVDAVLIPIQWSSPAVIISVRRRNVKDIEEITSFVVVHALPNDIP